LGPEDRYPMDVFERIISDDVIARSEFFDSRKRQAYNAPLRRLMLAVLRDALDCLSSGESHGASTAQRKAAREAAEWISDTSAEHLFSFGCVCETLGIHPGALRDSLRNWIAYGPRLARRPPVMRQSLVRTSPYRRPATGFRTSAKVSLIEDPAQAGAVVSKTGIARFSG
jgi:hypothetical protein